MKNKLKASFAKHTESSRVTIFIATFALIGFALLVASKAATPTSSIEPESGSCSSKVSLVADASASNGKAVKFGISGDGCVASTAGAPTPMPIISRGKPAQASSGTASNAVDSNYDTGWSPTGTSGWMAIDLSSVAASQRTNVNLAWYVVKDDAFTNSSTTVPGGSYPGTQYRSWPTSYTIEVGNAPSGQPATTLPTSWTSIKTVDNTTAAFLSAIQNFDMTGFTWIRLTASTNLSGFNLNVDVVDASKGQTDGIMMIGDSIDVRYAAHWTNSDNYGNIGPNIDTMIQTETSNAYHPVIQDAGVPATRTDHWTGVINARLAEFPGKYVTLNLGTNDCTLSGGGGTLTAFKGNMKTLVDAVIAANKVPIIPHMTWSNDSNQQKYAQQCNTDIDNLIAQYASTSTPILAGPDLYKTLEGQTAWFQGTTDVHPIQPGIIALRCAWAYSLTQIVYKTNATAISSCNGYASLPAPLTTFQVKVSGNKLVDANGNTLILKGANRMGGEYDCVQNKPLFDGKPVDVASVNAMKTWGINAVRIPTNEDCWLGINGQPNNGTTAAQYQQGILNYIQTLTSNGMYVVIDLHWTAPGTYVSNSQSYGPDADHSITFWQQVATALKGNPAVIFDLYNEPLQNYVTADASSAWNCWLNGCTVTKYMTATNTGVTVPAYQLTGVNQLISAIRGTGATNAVLVNGMDWANDVTQFMTHRPTDSLNQIIVGAHEYPRQCDGNNNTCNGGDTSLTRRTGNWDTYFGNPSTAGSLSNTYPVLIGEIGDRTGSALVVGTDFLPTLLPYAQSHGWSYFGWAWFSNQDPDNILLMQTSTYQGGNGDYLTPTPTLGEGACYKNWILNGRCP